MRHGFDHTSDAKQVIPVRCGTIQRVAFVILSGPRGRILPDSQRAAECRVSLKLSAIAYAQSRVGLDAERISGTAAGWLGHCALRYCEALDDEPAGSRSIGDPTDGVVAALSRLSAVALAYAGSRMGADACPELSRDALALLCSAAVDLGRHAIGRDDEEDARDERRSDRIDRLTP